MFLMYSFGLKEGYKVCNFFYKPTNLIGETKLSDNETLFKLLMKKTQDGDGTSYTKLLEGLSIFLKHYLRKRIFDRNEIDEVTQEILLAVHKSLHTYDNTKSFMGWFLAITEYKIVDFVRSLKKRSKTLDLNSIASFFDVSNSDSDLKIDIEKAINNLSSREKDVLTLIKADGHSINEVAKQLNLSEVIAHRAYINIKIYLGVRL